MELHAPTSVSGSISSVISTPVHHHIKRNTVLEKQDSYARLCFATVRVSGSVYNLLYLSCFKDKVKNYTTIVTLRFFIVNL